MEPVVTKVGHDCLAGNQPWSHHWNPAALNCMPQMHTTSVTSDSEQMRPDAYHGKWHPPEAAGSVYPAPNIVFVFIIYVLYV